MNLQVLLQCTIFSGKIPKIKISGLIGRLTVTILEISKNSVIVLIVFNCSLAQIIAAQEEMLRKERELEEARKKLAQIRQQQYKFLPSELREDED